METHCLRRRLLREVEMIAKSYVYFIRDEKTGNIKIGQSINPDQRRKAIETEFGCKMTILATIAQIVPVEALLHNKFSHLHVRGEWFRPDPELLEMIETYKGRVDIEVKLPNVQVSANAPYSTERALHDIQCICEPFTMIPFIRRIVNTAKRGDIQETYYDVRDALVQPRLSRKSSPFTHKLEDWVTLVTRNKLASK
jgi:hypothetical protein